MWRRAGMFDVVAACGNRNIGSNDKCSDEPVWSARRVGAVPGMPAPTTGAALPIALAIGFLVGGLGLSLGATGELRRGRRER